MYNTYTRGSKLPSNVEVFPQRAAGPIFSGAPAAVFNPGPSGSSGMGIFGSAPSGELMTSVADDALYSEQVAPIMTSFAVMTELPTDKKSIMLPKGTVVTIRDLPPGKFPKETKRAKRDGLELMRMYCPHCDDVTTPDPLTGVVGVLAEAFEVFREDKYTTVTVALENATELSPEYLLESVAPKRANGQGQVDAVFPGQMLKLGSNNKGRSSFRKATVLTAWSSDDLVGPLVCLHAGLFP